MLFLLVSLLRPGIRISSSASGKGGSLTAGSLSSAGRGTSRGRWVPRLDVLGGRSNSSSMVLLLMRDEVRGLNTAVFGVGGICVLGVTGVGGMFGASGEDTARKLSFGCDKGEMGDTRSIESR